MSLRWMQTEDGEAFMRWLVENYKHDDFRTNIARLAEFVYTHHMTPLQFDIFLRMVVERECKDRQNVI